MATIVLGEASESEDELDEETSCTPTISQSKDTPSFVTSTTHRNSSSSFTKGISDTDASLETSAETPSAAQMVINPKYKSLFQKRLVEEMFTLRGQAESIAHKSYNDSTKQIKQLGRNTDHLITNLKKSAYQLQLLTNDLFRLEDTIDLVNSNQPFSKLSLTDKYTPKA
ncbi:hypothetical protein EB796_016459 [Bugula neritina]|uniref:Biogenesis of lysosome-related organelles complex 1 subunit 3 n=1 Tax=Bugula neritina TaxID=10212 RepID=A0A7J7JG18_BUGNE|nr:hypothetical protein EB796_016459 [Bugula neritina]